MDLAPPFRHDGLMMVARSKIERRTEVRTDVKVVAVMIPLAEVSKRVKGHVINVSPHGVKVRLPKPPSELRSGDVYRIHSNRDLMLCEVRNWRSEMGVTDIGLRVIHATMR
jgi:hypothetical protein